MVSWKPRRKKVVGRAWDAFFLEKARPGTTKTLYLAKLGLGTRPDLAQPEARPTTIFIGAEASLKAVGVMQ